MQRLTYPAAYPTNRALMISKPPITLLPSTSSAFPTLKSRRISTRHRRSRMERRQLKACAGSPSPPPLKPPKSRLITRILFNSISKFKKRVSEVVYAVGGGLTADAAKYYPCKLYPPLVVLPTAVSVDAFIIAA